MTEESISMESDQLPLGKKFLFSAILIALLLVCFELVFFAEFNLRRLGFRLEAFGWDKSNAENMKYDDRYRIVSPKPGVAFKFITSEYSDSFVAQRVSGGASQIGFWNGRFEHKKPLQILAYGDSFTRGVGSTLPHELSWTSLVAKRNSNVEFLVDSENTAKYQLSRYRKLGKAIKHNVVLQATVTADFFENTRGCFAGSEEVLERLPMEIDRTDYLHAYVYPSAYWAPELNYMDSHTIKSYSVAAMYRVAKRFTKFQPNEKFSSYEAAHKAACARIENEQSPEYVRESYLANLTSALPGGLVNQCGKDNKLCFSYISKLYETGNEDRKNELIDYLASYIKEFSEEAKRNNAEFILLIFPEKQLVYSYRYPELFNGLDLGYPVRRLKQVLPGTRILDLTDGLVAVAKKLDSSNRYLYYRNDGHWTPEGYAAAADLIEKFLNDENLRHH